jgi:hypothetical protein
VALSRVAGIIAGDDHRRVAAAAAMMQIGE